MGRLLIYIIRIYQIIPFSTHQMCRHTPTCSNYMIEAIETHGLKKGLQIGIKRILRCRPFGTSGYDPVPKKEDNF